MTAHSSGFSNQAFVSLLPPLTRSASAVSNSLDVSNYDSVTLLVNVGATGDTFSATNRVEASVQESDDNTTWTPVADSDLVKAVSGGQATGTFMLLTANPAAGTVYPTGYRGNKRYVRVALNNYGTTSNGTPMDVLALGGRPRYAPVNY